MHYCGFIVGLLFRHKFNYSLIAHSCDVVFLRYGTGCFLLRNTGSKVGELPPTLIQWLDNEWKQRLYRMQSSWPLVTCRPSEQEIVCVARQHSSPSSVFYLND